MFHVLCAILFIHNYALYTILLSSEQTYAFTAVKCNVSAQNVEKFVDGPFYFETCY